MSTPHLVGFLFLWQRYNKKKNYACMQDEIIFFLDEDTAVS